MTKVLPGSSRAAFDFVLKQWRGLINISLMPMAIILIVSWYQLQGLGTIFEFIAMQAKMGDKMEMAQIAPLMENLMKFYAVGFLALIAMVWLFVRVVRFWKTDQGSAFAVTQGEIGSTFLTILYGLGMLLLTTLLYVAGIVAFAIIAGIGGANLGGSNLGALGAIILGLVAVAMVLGLVLFLYRFLVGLPGVAMGETPGFFSDIWPLAKGESWGVPSRLLLWSLVAMIPFGILALTFSVPLMSEVQAQLMAQDKPQVTPDMLARIVQTMAPLQIINLLIQMPLIWFFSALLSEAHYRFRAKLSESKNR